MKEPESMDNKNQESPGQGDFYMENSMMVFTEAFHLRRGYCCQSGCRHCPYGFEKSKDKDENDKSFRPIL